MNQFEINYHVSMWKNGEVSKKGSYKSILEANQRILDLSMEFNLMREMDSEGYVMAYDNPENSSHVIVIVNEKGEKHEIYQEMIEIYGEQKVGYVIGLVEDVGYQPSWTILDDLNLEDEKCILDELFCK